MTTTREHFWCLVLVVVVIRSLSFERTEITSHFPRCAITNFPRKIELLLRAGLVDKTNNIIDKRNDDEENTYQIINVRHTGRVDLLIQHRVPLAQPSVEFRDAHIRKSEEIELLYNEVFETKSEAKLADESVTLRGRKRRRRRKRRTKRRRKRRRASKRVFSGTRYQCAFVRV